MLERMRLADDVLASRLLESDAAPHWAEASAPSSNSLQAGVDASQLAMRLLSGDRQARTSPPTTFIRVRSLPPPSDHIVQKIVGCRWNICGFGTARSTWLSTARVDTLEALHTCLGAALLRVAAALGDAGAGAAAEARPSPSTDTRRQAVIFAERSAEALSGLNQADASQAEAAPRGEADSECLRCVGPHWQHIGRGSMLCSAAPWTTLSSLR